MGSIQVPVKINGCQFANFTGAKNFPHFGAVRRVTVVEGHAAGFSGSFFGIDDGLNFPFVGSHGFFADDIGSQFHSAAYKIIVRIVVGCYYEHLRFGFEHHFFKIGVNRAIGADELPADFEPAGIFIAQTYKLYVSGILLHHTFAPHAGTSVAGPYKRHSCFFQ